MCFGYAPLESLLGNREMFLIQFFTIHDLTDYRNQQKFWYIILQRKSYYCQVQRAVVSHPSYNAAQGFTFTFTAEVFLVVKKTKPLRGRQHRYLGCWIEAVRGKAS